jgi:hypothetical protein
MFARISRRIEVIARYLIRTSIRLERVLLCIDRTLILKIKVSRWMERV